MEELNPALISTEITTRIVAKDMSLEELMRFSNAATFGFDPREMEGYKKVQPLFVENNGTEMHQDTLAALNRIVQERLRVGK